MQPACSRSGCRVRSLLAAETVDLLLREAELGQHLVRVLADEWRRALGAARRIRAVEGKVHIDALAAAQRLLARDGPEGAAMGELAVRADLRHGGHPARGHAGLREARLPGAGIGCCQRRDERLAERIRIGDPVGKGGEARVVCEVRESERAGEGGELALGGRGDHQEAVAGREGVGSRVVGLRPVAVRPGLLPVHLPEVDRRRHDADRGVEHGKVEMVALAGALAVVERG